MEKKVLDKGFVRLIDLMGGDSAVVQAARVSYGQGSKGDEKDKNLIHYLMKHDHGSPFEHAVFKFHVKAPIFVARQWFRHRVASYNEISGRYTTYKMEFYVPDKVRVQDSKNKQGSNEAEIPFSEILDIERYYEIVSNIYNELLNYGVAKELARIILPMSVYTQWYWTVNARSLMNFLRLRMDVHAQWEIRQYANAIYSIFKSTMPWTAEAFEKVVMPTFTIA